MKVYSIVAENLNKAVEEVKKINGENFQILYQNILKGGFPYSKEVEIGYCVSTKKVNIPPESIGNKKVEDEEFLNFLNSSMEIIKTKLIQSCFSYNYIENTIESFIKQVSTDKSIKDYNDVKRFLKKFTDNSMQVDFGKLL